MRLLSELLKEKDWNFKSERGKSELRTGLLELLKFLNHSKQKYPKYAGELNFKLLKML